MLLSYPKQPDGDVLSKDFPAYISSNAVEKEGEVEFLCGFLMSSSESVGRTLSTPTKANKLQGCLMEKVHARAGRRSNFLFPIVVQ